MTRVKRSMRSWVRRHKKQVAIHSFVIAGFLVFTLFVAEPLFDRLERIPGEAQIHRIDLPAETGGITARIDDFASDGRTVVEIRGWAFVEGEDSKNGETYIVLESDKRTYVFDTNREVRPDVTAHFEELGLNLDYSGFTTLIPIRRVANGEYTVGIYIRKGDIEALQYTNRSLVKARGSVELSP